MRAPGGHGTPLVSVLLTSWNTREQTRACLDSLHRVAGDLAYEVIAVDNGSRDGSADLLAADPRVRLIRNATNRGFAAAVNQAYRASTGALLLVLNSDIVFHPASLSIMVDRLRADEGLSGVSPQYRNPDGTLQPHYVRPPSFAASLTLFTGLRRLPGFARARARYDLADLDLTVAQPLASASCLLLRRSAAGPESIFDEHFPIFWNDVWLVTELLAAGHRFVSVPTAVVTHTRGASCVLLGSRARFRHLLGGLVRYLQRTEPAYRVIVFRLVVIMDYVVRSVAARSTVLGPLDLVAALRGDLGPLPDGDTRPWDVVLDGLDLPADPDRRRAVVELTGRPGGLQAERTGPGHWLLRIGTTAPGGAARRGPLARLHLRIAAARLRSWLDAQTGPRTLYVGPEHEAVRRWLGEDVAVGRRSSVGVGS